MTQVFARFWVVFVVGICGFLAMAGDDVPVRVIGQDAVTDIDWSPDGVHAVVGSEYGMAQIHSLVAGEAVVTLSGHRGKITAVEYSPDGAVVYTGSHDGTVRVWNAEDGAPLRVLDALDVYERTGGDVDCLAVSPDGTLVAAGYFPDNFPGRTEDGRVRVWDTASGAIVQDLLPDAGDGGLGAVEAVAFSKDGMRLASGSYRRGSPDAQLFSQWNVGTWDLFGTFALETYEVVEAIAYADDGGTLIAGGRVWLKKFDATSGEEVFDFERADGNDPGLQYPGAMDLSPDGSRVVVANSRLVEWDVGTGVVLATYSFSNGTVIPRDTWGQGQLAAAYSPNGAFILSCGGGGICRLREVASGEEIWKFSGNAGGSYHSTRLGTLFGKQVLVTRNGTRRLEDGLYFDSIWDVETGLELTRFGFFSSPIRAAGLSPNAREARLYAATGFGQPAQLFAWDGQSGASLGSTNLFLLYSLEVSGDGKWLVSTSQEEHFWVYSAETGEVRWEFDGHPREVGGVAVHSETEMATFSPDGVLVASGGAADGLAKLWSLETGEMVWELQAGMEESSSNRVLVDFSPDGKRLVTTSLLEEAGQHTEYAMRLWDTETGGMVGEAFAPVPDFTEGMQAGVGTEVKFAPDGRYFATGSQDERVLLWDAERMEVVRELWLGPFVRPGLQSIEFSSDGRELYVGGAVTRVWDVSDVTDRRAIYGKAYWRHPHPGYWSSLRYPDSEVRAVGEGGEVYRTSAGTRGDYRFRYLPEGTYVVVAEGVDEDGQEYLSLPRTVEVVDGSEQQVSLRMRKRVLSGGTAVHGKITDGTDGVGIGRALIKLESGGNERQWRAYSSGRYRIGAPGEWFVNGVAAVTMTVTGEGYEERVMELNLSEGLRVERNVALTRGEGFQDGSVGGWVVSAEDGAALVGATVTVSEVGGREQRRTTETGADGSYLVEGLYPGSHRVVVGLSPYHGQEETVAVSTGGAVRADFELERDANGEEGTVKLVESSGAGGGGVTVSWPAYWGSVVVERSEDLENWEVVDGVEGNAHVFAAEAGRFYVRVRFEEGF